GGMGVAAKCDTPVGPGLPSGAPVLTKGTWKDISPAGVNIGTGAIFTQGMAVDPCNPAILYLTVDAFDSPKGGLFKSLDAGSAWGDQNTKCNSNAGVLESKDGGMTWIAHPPRDGFGQGDAIHFLYKPELGIGDSNTWLFSTQSGTRYRTIDAGKNWIQVGSSG